MRKEVIFAIGFGAIFGISIAFGIWKFNNQQISLLTTPAPTITPKNNPLIAKAKDSNGLSIAGPSQSSLITSSPITISGTYNADKPVILSTDTKDFFVNTDRENKFQASIEIKPGINSIVVSGFGDKKAEVVSIFTYSEKTLLENALVAVGRVTDKTDAGIQVDTVHGQVIQVAIDPQTVSVVSMITTTKEVAFSDVGIGDYIAVIGSQDSANLFTGERLIISTTPNLDTRHAYRGNVSSLTRNQFTFKFDGREATVKSSNAISYYQITDNTVKAARFTSLKENSEIIAVGKITDTAFEPRSIFILE